MSGTRPALPAPTTGRAIIARSARRSIFGARWSTGSSRADGDDRTFRTAPTPRTRTVPCLSGRHEAGAGSAADGDGNREAPCVGADRHPAAHRQEPTAGGATLCQVPPLVAEL